MEREFHSGTKILKFKNQEAYLYGDTQLIYFSDIREHLKTGLPIELVLINVASSDKPLHRKSTMAEHKLQKQMTKNKMSIANSNINNIQYLSNSN